MNLHRLTRSVVLGLTVVALTASTAGAVPADLRSPDARDAARAPQIHAGQDLRSPDTRDHADNRGTFSAPEVTVVKVTEPAQAPSGDLDWADAGIGAGGMLGLILVALASILAVVHHRKSTRAGHTAIGA